MSVISLQRAIKIYFCYIFIIKHLYPAEKIQYFSMEHPNVTYYNPKYLKYANLTSQRYGRGNPVFYVGLHLETLITFDNNVLVDFYFYEFLSNVYKRSFIEMHYKFCDLVKKDKIFGPTMRQGKYLKPCPFPPDDYHMYNMTLDMKVFPPGFPITKGRIYVNLTYALNKEFIGGGYMDIAVKEINKTSKKN